MRQGDVERDLFQPLRPATGTKVVLAVVIGPIGWGIAWSVAAWLVHRKDTIQFGLLVALASFLIVAPVLALLTRVRDRERGRFEREARRFDDRA